MTNLLKSFFESRMNNQPFAVVVTDKGDKKLYIKAFIRLLKKYPGLRQNFFDKRTINSLDYSSVIVFGTSQSFDYTIIETNEELMKLRNIKYLDLVEDQNSVIKALEEYIRRNNIRSKEDVDLEINIEISVERPVRKPKVVATFDEVTFFNTFVRIGWDVYTIKVDPFTGKEYIIIGDELLQIKKNIFGQKYLAA